MGLDQFLSKRIYIGAKYEHNKVEGIIDLKKDSKPVAIDLKKVSFVIEEVGCWRKANQIHAWMVANIQNGEDDCGEYDISLEQRKELYNLCKQALENRDKAPKLLPTTKGFFFGSTDYDEYYYQELQDTIEILEPTLSENDTDSYYYSSSW